MPLGSCRILYGTLHDCASWCFSSLTQPRLIAGLSFCANPSGAQQMAWKFYVYELTDDQGASQYVGKGSGGRLRRQMASFGLIGTEVARFKREADAYAFERDCIAARTPALNRHPGGNGSRAKTTRAREPLWVREIQRMGTRVAAARILCNVHRVAPHLVPAGSKLDAIRRVAYG